MIGWWNTSCTSADTNTVYTIHDQNAFSTFTNNTAHNTVFVCVCVDPQCAGSPCGLWDRVHLQGQQGDCGTQGQEVFAQQHVDWSEPAQQMLWVWPQLTLHSHIHSSPTWHTAPDILYVYFITECLILCHRRSDILCGDFMLNRDSCILCPHRQNPLASLRSRLSSETFCLSH